jgi:hypothetical protein
MKVKIEKNKNPPMLLTYVKKSGDFSQFLGLKVFKSTSF